MKTLLSATEILSYFYLCKDPVIVSLALSLNRDAFETLIDNFGGTTLRIPTRQEFNKFLIKVSNMAVDKSCERYYNSKNNQKGQW